MNISPPRNVRNPEANLARMQNQQRNRRRLNAMRMRQLANNNGMVAQRLNFDGEPMVNNAMLMPYEYNNYRLNGAGRRSKKRSKRRSPRRSQLRGGAGSCVNAYDDLGIKPLDPFSMEPIPSNRILRVPVNHDDPNTDYYCFDQTNLFQWIYESHNTNPFTNLPFSNKDALYMRNNAHMNLRSKDGFIQNWGTVYMMLINWID